MARFFLKRSANGLTAALVASAILLVSAQAQAEPGSGGPFLGLSGHWSGAGTVTMTNGATERLRCRVAYTVNAAGKGLQQSLRCASDSYKVEISSNVISEGGSLSGSWAEATRGLSGNISGRASGAEIVANVAAAGFAARLDVRTHGDKQSVTIRPQGGTECLPCRSLCAKDKALRPAISRTRARLSRHEVAWRERRRRNASARQLILRMEAAHEWRMNKGSRPPENMNSFAICPVTATRE